MPAPTKPIRLGFFTKADSVLHRRIFTGMFAFARDTPGVQVAHWKPTARSRANAFRSLHLDGLLVTSIGDYEDMGAPRLPAICAGSVNRVCWLPRICDDQIWMGTIAARHLVDRGLKHFAYCGFKFHHGSTGRCEGFQKELAVLGRTCSRFEFSSSRDQGLAFNSPAEQARLRRWLLTLPVPGAVFAFCDAVAVVVMQCCAAIGRSVPDQVALLSVDNDPFQINSFPCALSSIDPGSAKTGYDAAKALHRWVLQGIAPPPETRVRRAVLFARQTTGRYHLEDDLVSRLLDLIDSRIASPLPVVRMASLLGCSRRTLERRVRRCVGISVHEVITRERLERVKRSLADPAISVKAVAVQYGFSSPQQLGAVFLRNTGVTPGVWRTFGASGRTAE